MRDLKKEIEKLTAKENCYTYIIARIRDIAEDEGFDETWLETANAVVRQLENQRKMIRWAIRERQRSQV